MQFFRAYYDENGVIVYELRKIAMHYIFSGSFFINLLAAFPMQVRDTSHGHLSLLNLHRTHIAHSIQFWSDDYFDCRKQVRLLY